LTFFCEDDYREYISLMAEWCFHFAIEVWAYCWMANPVHLVVVPESEDALRKGVREAHRRYTRRFNFPEGWRGHLWQGRFFSFPKVSPLLQIVGDWKEFLLDGDGEKEIKEIRRHERTARPLGRDGFVIALEKALGRTLRYQKSGPQGKKKE
jgi:putative transposase